MALSEIVEEDEADITMEEEEEEKENEKFKNFDVVTDASDHFYLCINHLKNRKSKITVEQLDSFSTPSSNTYKKIMKEWKILDRDLPDSIYVRAYETRIDLLRVAIVGPAGTPYHDGLFFFDIAFPPDYPTKPPLVHYHSFGLRINPNLYQTGYVCLSLLNTWYSRKKCELWNPEQSTILQVLVSIQAMVLNTEPFYNEPGMELIPGMGIILNRRKQSARYSENAFIKSCKTMVYLLRNPPMNFKDLVISHFLNRAPHILSACNAYMKGREKIGEYYQANAQLSSLSIITTSENTSTEFKRDMLPAYRNLLEAFAFTGDSVKSFVEEFSREEIERGNERMTLVKDGARKKMETGVITGEVNSKKKKKKKKSGVWNRIKDLFGLKKTGEKKSLVGVSNL